MQFHFGCMCLLYWISNAAHFSKCGVIGFMRYNSLVHGFPGVADEFGLRGLISR